MDWISVDDAVPPDFRNVLVVVYCNGESRSHVWMGYREVYKNGTIKWIAISQVTGSWVVSSSRHKNSTSKVTHWMPIPAPPERPVNNI